LSEPSFVQRPIDARSAYAQVLRNMSDALTFLEQADGISGLSAGRGLPALVSAFGLRFGDPLSLSLQHHLALELSEGRRRSRWSFTRQTSLINR
jgi:hypothetical protein